MGPGGPPKVGVGEQPRRGAEKGLNLESKILREREAHTVRAHLADGAALWRFTGCGCQGQRRKYLTCQTVRTNETVERVRVHRELSFQLTFKVCICKHTLTLTHSFHIEDLVFPKLPPLANPGRSQEWSSRKRD